MTKPKQRNRADVRSVKSSSHDGQQALWLWGTHAVVAALANPARHCHQILATENAARRLGLKNAQLLDGRSLGDRLPRGAVHQGVAAQVEPLKPTELDDLMARPVDVVIVLDQLSDPHNLGAVMRSAAAFGVEAFIAQTRHTPPITGIVAKAAAGAVETVAECRVVNIARTLERLKQAGYFVMGLEGSAATVLADAIPQHGRLAIVMGAEGAGLRPGVAKACDQLSRIPLSPKMESLNLSNAAAVAFYEMVRTRLGSDGISL